MYLPQLQYCLSIHSHIYQSHSHCILLANVHHSYNYLALIACLPQRDTCMLVSGAMEEVLGELIHNNLTTEVASS